MTKKEFQLKIPAMLKVLRTQKETYQRFSSDSVYHKDMAGIRANDPVLEKMLRDHDQEHVASLARIIHYISTRVEN